MVKRAAFTFLELIFAIVIIGISVISLPLMIQTTSEGIEKNLVQEAVFAASAQINQVLSADWDARSIEDGNNTYARVVDDGTCSNDTNSTQHRLKPGHVYAPKHRRCIDSNSTTIALGATTAGGFVMEDYTTQGINNPTSSNTGYKDEYATTITVTTNAFFAGANNANIKMIQANISDSSSGNLLTSLRAYSANIGEVDFHSRTY